MEPDKLNSDHGQHGFAESFRLSVVLGLGRERHYRHVDPRGKEWRGGLNEGEIRAAKRLSKQIGIYRWNDAIALEG